MKLFPLSADIKLKERVLVAMGETSRAQLSRALYYNPPIRMAQIADPDLARKLQHRYAQYSKCLPHQILTYVNRSPVRRATVSAITLEGGASLFRKFAKVDVNIFVEAPGQNPSCHRFDLWELNGSKRKVSVEMAFLDIRNLSPLDYASTMFTNPLLFGQKPDLYASRIPDLLCESAAGMLSNFDRSIIMMASNSSRKAMHFLGYASQYIFAFCDRMLIELPAGYREAVTTLFRLDAEENYQHTVMLHLREQIGQWQSDLESLCAAWAKMPQDRDRGD